MKKYCIIALLAAIFCGCDNLEIGNTNAPFLKIDKESLSFETEGGRETVKISSNCDWRITGGDSWCTPSNTEGSGKASIIFTATENSATSDLKTTFYFEFEGEFGTEIVELDVEQKAIQVDDVASLMDDAVFISYCYANFDLNKDGKISIKEANTAKVIDIEKESKLISVKGIEVFTNLEEVALYKCSSLRSIDLSKNNKITRIGDEAFYNCSSLTSVTIPNSVTEIGYGAFRYCSNLTSVTIPNSVTEIGSDAFSGCSSLTSVTIPNSVTKIGWRAFSGCRSLTSVIIPDSVTEIGDSEFESCSSLTNIVIGNSVTKIGDSAFYKCSSLTSVIIPDSVTEIGSYTFYSCSSLTNIVIGNSVTTIGIDAFEYCKGLDRVYCKPITPPTLYNNIFSDCGYFTIYVPQAYVYKYKAADEWKRYEYIIEGYDFK